MCNGSIQDGGGHPFYSSNRKDGITEGNMLLCDRCISGVVLRLKDGHVSESNPLFGLFATEYGEGDRMRKLQIEVINSITVSTGSLKDVASTALAPMPPKRRPVSYM